MEKRRKVTSSGQSAEAAELNEWFLYKHLTFLRDSICKRKSTSSYNTNAIYIQETQIEPADIENLSESNRSESPEPIQCFTTIDLDLLECDPAIQSSFSRQLASTSTTTRVSSPISKRRIDHDDPFNKPILNKRKKRNTKNDESLSLLKAKLDNIKETEFAYFGNFISGGLGRLDKEIAEQAMLDITNIMSKAQYNNILKHSNSNINNNNL